MVLFWMDGVCWFLVLLFQNNLTTCVPQENGQRRYGGPPPDWEGPPPERGSEIFVGKLPRDLFEDELVPLCEKVRSCCLTLKPNNISVNVQFLFLNSALPVSSLVRSTR